MGTTPRFLAIAGLTAIGLACEGRAVFASGGGAPQSRVRTESGILAMLIREAFERSETFRALVAAIDRTNGIVYLTAGPCGRVRACLLHRVVVAGPSRMLYIVVNVQDADLTFIPSIAHELRHALEVLGDARITSDRAIRAFYEKHGLRLRGMIETRTAIAAGDAVRDEIRRSISR